MLVEFTQPGGTSTYVSGDHVEDVAPAANGAPGTAILLQDGTVINVTQAPAEVFLALNASLQTVLVAQPVT